MLYAKSDPARLENKRVKKKGRICFLLFLGAWRFKRGNWVWSDVELSVDLFSLLSARSWLLKLTLTNLNSCYLPTIPFLVQLGPAMSNPNHFFPNSQGPQLRPQLHRQGLRSSAGANLWPPGGPAWDAAAAGLLSSTGAAGERLPRGIACGSRRHHATVYGAEGVEERCGVYLQSDGGIS